MILDSTLSFFIGYSNLAQRKKADDADGDDGDGETETALDLEDKWDVERKSFTPADRITEADRSNDLKSTDRKLDSTLYLLVKQSIEGRDHWVLPQATWEQGETLRQVACLLLFNILIIITIIFICLFFLVISVFKKIQSNDATTPETWNNENSKIVTNI